MSHAEFSGGSAGSGPGLRPGYLAYRLPSRPAGGALLVALALCAVLAGCHAPPAASVAPRPVVAAVVHDSTPPAQNRLPGEVQARFATPLSFRVAGKIIERRVHLGDTVKKGQVLARLDPADAGRNAASSAAQRAAAQHRLVFATQQLERDRAQAKQDLISRTQLEQTEDAYSAALAQRDQAVQQAALAADQLNYNTLVADHDGVITAEQADTGQVVSAGQAVFGLAWSDAIDVVADAPENALAALPVGTRASVTLGALPGRTFNAQVRELAPAADPQSRTYRVKLTLEQPGPDVRLGMSANIAFQGAAGSNPGANGAAPRSITLPATALFHQDERPAVWVVQGPDNVLVLRPVTVASYGARTVTISAGIADGERVVLQGVHAVNAGQKVSVMAPLHPEDFAS